MSDGGGPPNGGLDHSRQRKRTYNSSSRPMKRTRLEIRKESNHKEESSHKEDRDTFSELEAHTKSRDIGHGPRSLRSHRSSGTTRPTPLTSQTQDGHATLTQRRPGISGTPDYVTALVAGRFSEQALARITSLGFDPDRAARTAILPIGGRLQKAKETWGLITGAPASGKGSFIQSVVNFGLTIEWDDGLPGVPHDGRNPPASKDSKIILDTEVTNMLRKNVIRLADNSIPGVISGYFARPKKAAGKFRLIVSHKYTNSFITWWKF